MRKIVLLLAFAGLCSALCAQSEETGVRFQERTTLKKLMEQSAETGKPIFIDMYTTWCPPCKAMDQKIFSLKDAGAYFNERFINAKFDAEGRGAGIAQRYGVTGYPTFLILDSSGNEIGRVVGAILRLDIFIENIENAMKKE